MVSKPMRRTRSLPSEYEVLGLQRTELVAIRNPQSPETEQPSNQNDPITLTCDNAASNLERHNLESIANESDPEDGHTVPGDNALAVSEVTVRQNVEGLAPNSDAETQPTADYSGDHSDPHRPRDIWRRLKSLPPRDVRGQVIILLRFIVAAFTVSFTIWYGWNGLFPNTPSPKFLWDEPNNSIFVIGILSYVSTLFINNLASATYNRFRWVSASHEEGIGALDWLACSPSTSISSLIHLVVSRFPSIRENESWHRSWHRLFSLHRLVLLAFQATISVILMFNVTINTVYFPIPNTTLSGIGGVIPLDQDYIYYQQFSRTGIQGIALTDYRSTQRGFFISAHHTVIGTYAAGDPHCAPGATGCLRTYLTQAPVLNGTIPPIPRTPTSPDSTEEQLPYVRFWNSPIYDITFSTVGVPSGLQGLQGTYGYDDNALILVAVKDRPEPETSNSSIFLGCRVCGSRVERSCGLNLQNSNLEHTIYPTNLKLNVIKRTADLTYYLRNKSVIAIDNVSQHGETQYVDPLRYLGFFSAIFPIWPQRPSDASEKTLEQLLFEVSQTACQFQAIQRGWNIPYIDLLALPFIIQQHSIESMSNFTSLPAENNITSSFVTPRTKISLNPISFWVFTIFSMLSIGSCGVFYKICFLGAPELSGFEEIDFVLKQRCEMGFFKDQLGQSPSQVHVFQKLAQTKLRVAIEKQTLELLPIHVPLRRFNRGNGEPVGRTNGRRRRALLRTRAQVEP